MKQYIATAWNDWGEILRDEKVKAGSFKVACGKAAYLAQYRAKQRGHLRRRMKHLTVKVVLVGEIKKETSGEVSG